MKPARFGPAASGPARVYALPPQQRQSFRSRKAITHLNNPAELMTHRVTAVRSIKSMIPIGIIRYDPNTVELPKLILNSTKSETSLTHQFAHISPLVRAAEQCPQNLRSHFWEQNIQQRHLRMSHALSRLDCLKQSSSNENAQLIFSSCRICSGLWRTIADRLTKNSTA